MTREKIQQELLRTQGHISSGIVRLDRVTSQLMRLKRRADRLKRWLRFDDAELAEQQNKWKAAAAKAHTTRRRRGIRAMELGGDE